jgi:hypothetical protein
MFDRSGACETAQVVSKRRPEATSVETQPPGLLGRSRVRGSQSTLGHLALAASNIYSKLNYERAARWVRLPAFGILVSPHDLHATCSGIDVNLHVLAIRNIPHSDILDCFSGKRSACPLCLSPDPACCRSLTSPIHLRILPPRSDTLHGLCSTQLPRARLLGYDIRKSWTPSRIVSTTRLWA